MLGSIFNGGSSTGFSFQGWSSAHPGAIAIDFDAHKVWMAADAASPSWNQGTSGTQDPTTGAGGIPFDAALEGQVLFPWYYMIGSGDHVTFNFGASAFAGTVPSGFSPWNVAAAGAPNDDPTVDVARWVGGAPGGEGATALDGLSDVVLTSAAEGDQLTYDAATGKWVNVRPKYILTTNFNGVMAASQDLLHHKLAADVTFPADFGDFLGYRSGAGATANATGDTVITVAKAAAASPNSWTTIGTITIAAGGVTAALATSSGAAQAGSKGDVIRLQGPSSADATLAGFYCTVVARES